MGTTVHVTAASRLHFGMFSFGRPEVRQFGGVGVMVDQPALRLRFSPGEALAAEGPLAERAVEFARRAGQQLAPGADLRCRIEILQAPPQHAGLGSGTQLGLSVAAGLARWLGRPVTEPEDLASLAGRGLRSAVGTYGFVHGGMIVEAGKAAGQSLAPLVCRVELPGDWRFVLVVPPAGADSVQGLCGEEEQQAFSELPPVPLETTDELCREALLHLVPAARQGCFDEFAESLYRYGYQAGLCFAARQGGAYASERLAALVELMRRLGAAGTGQSSWGPTLFGLLPSEEAAAQFADRLRQQPEAAGAEIVIARPTRHGAKIE